MKIITHSQIVDLTINPQECVQWVKAAFISKEQSTLPPKISIKLPENVFFNTMPCYIPDQKVIGVKMVSRYPSNSPTLESCLVLFDAQNGDLLAFMDANWITAMRTGAVAATAIDLFQSDKGNTLSILGLGNTARASLLCLLEHDPGKVWDIKLLRYKDQADHFMERFRNYTNARFTIVDSTEELIRNSNIILSCVTAADQIIGQDEWFDPGVLVVPVHTRGFQNCDLFFDRVFADDTEHVKDFKYFSQFKSFDEIANVINGSNPGRISQQERILSYNIGIALHDIYFASKIYSMTKQSEGLAEIPFKENLPKFWV